MKWFRVLPLLVLGAGCNIEKPFGPKMWCGTFVHTSNVLASDGVTNATVQYEINGCFTWNPEEKGFIKVRD